MPTDASRRPVHETTFFEVDLIKAIAIPAVILIHSVRPPWNAGQSELELLILRSTRFAVPGFLAVSGFLYAGSRRTGWAGTLRRLRRILVPYLVASAGAQIFWASRGMGRDAARIAEELLLGNSFGTYYYVFVIFFLVLVTPLLARLPRRLIGILLGAALIAQGLSEALVIPQLRFVWQLRNPLLWWGYFLLGWFARLHYAAVSGWIAERRGWLVAALSTAIAIFIAVLASSALVWTIGIAMWLQIHAVLALLFTIACRRQVSRPTIRFLSDATYSIYLFHIFFIAATGWQFAATKGEFEPLAVFGTWAFALAGSLVVIALSHLILRRWSRDIIGA